MLVISALISVSCTEKGPGTPAEPTNAGEAEFKEKAQEYLDMLTEFEKVKPDIITEPEQVAVKLKEAGYSEEEVKAKVDKGETFTDDFPVFVYYESQAGKWRDMAQWFTDFSKEHPDSRWSDDSLFLLTLLPYMPGRDTDTNIFITATLKTFATTDVRLSVEDWTIEKFAEISGMQIMLRDDVTLMPSGTPFNEKCVALFTFSYAMITINNGNTREGVELLNGLIKRYPDSAMAKIASSAIKNMQGKNK